MGQRICVLLHLLLLLTAVACDRAGDTPSTQPAPRAGTIVSLSPAASDLLVGMGLTDRIVGISAYEANATLKADRPIAGDYQRIDWERIAQLRPAFLIVQGQADRLPAGIREHADALGITLITLQIDRLDDIYRETTKLGDRLRVPEAADKLVRQMQDQIAACARSTQTPVLLVHSEDALSAVGRDNYLNDLLRITGGRNVIEANGYVRLDREKLRSLQPQVIIALLPNATEAQQQQAKQGIGMNSDLPAVRAGRVYVIAWPDVLLPATPVKRLAKTFDQLLAAPATQPERP